MKLFLDIKFDGNLIESHQIVKTTTTIGRSGSDIIIDNPDISPKHLEIKLERRRIIVRDLFSKLGTMVGDRYISTPHMLLENETILINQHSLSMRLEKDGISTPVSNTVTGLHESPMKRGNEITVFNDSFRPHSFELKALNL
jgi:pSer/pThr/pTyr-binding forkhead associated (FHA) protein